MLKFIGVGVLFCGLLLAFGLAAAQGPGPDDWQNYVLFMDDFQGGADPAWESSGGWQADSAGGVSFFIARTPGAAWVSTGGDWTDYVYRMGARVDSGVLAINFRWTEAGRYILQYKPDGLYLVKEHPKGVFVPLAQGAAPTPGTWHSVAIGCEGGHIQVYIDQQPALDATDPDPLLQGTVGVGAVDGTVAAVGNVVVMELSHPLPAGGAPPVAQPNPGDQLSGGPNMVITNVTTDNATPDVGQQITLWVTVANWGTAQAENYDLIVIPNYSPGGANTPDTFQQLLTLEANAEQTVEVRTQYAAAGQYVLRVLVSGDWYLTGNVEPGGNRQWDVPIAVGGASAVSAQPDIVIAEATAADMQSPPGAVLSNFTVRNVGLADSGLFTVRWYPHGSSDEVGCSEDISLPAGASQEMHCIYHYSGTGEMHWHIVADADNDIAESNEDNNTYRGTVVVGEASAENNGGGGEAPAATGAPDLMFSNVVVTYSGGESNVMVAITVVNAGDTATAPFTVRWYPHGNSDEVGCSEDIAGLPPGASQYITCVYTYPHTGEMHWLAVVDAENEIAEADEDNNAFRGVVSLAGAAPEPSGAADVTITDALVVPLTTPNEVSITLTVQNVGTVDTPLFTVEWRPHLHSGEVGCSEDLALAAGEAQWVRCLYTYPKHGEMHWRAIVDVDNDVNEADESNNVWEGTVTVP